MGKTIDYTDWIGRTEYSDDDITWQAVAAMSATLDRDDPRPHKGDPLPPLWHWMFFTPKVRREGLGIDGHEDRGNFMPPVALPRRMFAGARYKFHAPLRIGETVTRKAEIFDITRKQGRSGPLMFVKVRYVYSMGKEIALEEIQEFVFREAPGNAPPPPPEPIEINDAPWRRTLMADPVSLFRYSALTFNGHRIHYDYPYATGVEGYPDLVVHGPLIASHLIDLCRVNTDDRAFSSFFFRAKNPLFANIPFDVVGGVSDDHAGFWLKALTPNGAVAMDAGGTFA